MARAPLPLAAGVVFLALCFPQTASADEALDPGLNPPEFGADLDDRPEHLGQKILYVNFDGANMSYCGNNKPQNNCSTIFGGTVLPYTGDAVKRASIIQVVRSKLMDFGVTVTDQRPQSGDYDMEMVGDWQGQNPSFAGVAPSIDCWDGRGGEVSFTLEKAGTSDGMSEIILQELAHTWGLAHVDEAQDLLFPTTQGSNKTFMDQCLQIVSDTMLNPSQSGCSHHSQSCGSYSQQNSYQEMLMIFGESTPDTIAPVVDIVSPEDGATLSDDFEIVVQLSDNQSPMILATTVSIDGDGLDTPVEAIDKYAAPAELVFPVTALPGGEYTISIAVEDEEGNPSGDQITIQVPGAAGDGSGDGGEDDGGGDGDDSGGADGGGPDIGSGDGERDAGCACRSVSSPHQALGLLGVGLLLLGAVRRRTV